MPMVIVRLFMDAPFELYAELAPGIDVDRTRRARSNLFANLAIGARWFP